MPQLVVPGCSCERCARTSDSHTPSLRAQRVLYSLLTEAQRLELIGGVPVQYSGEHHVLPHSFTVQGSEGHSYVLRTDAGPSGNVMWLHPPPIVGGSLCAYPPTVPMWDVITAQKLMLETDELRFLSIALPHTYHRPPWGR